MEAVSMQTLYNAHGKINWFGWIFFIGTLLIVVYTIYQWYENVQKKKKDEEMQTQKLMELEMNLREVRGAQYKKSNV